MKKITIYVDGASRGNPGPGAAGVVFYNQKKEIIKSYSEYLGEKITNNEAEYQAVIFGLKKFIALFGKKIATSSNIELKSDSELLVKQMKGEYKLTHPRIQELFIEVWNLKTNFGRVDFKLISREQNKEADKMANLALDEDKPKTLF